MKKTKCLNGDECLFLKRPGGCHFWHSLRERKLGRNQRKRIKKRQQTLKKAQKAVTQTISAQPVAAQPVPAQLVAAQPVAAQPVAAQPQSQVIQVVVRPLWRTFHRGCDDCSHEGCSKCHYRTVCGQEIVTAPSRLPREIACRRCGAVGDSDDLYCLKCGY